MGNLIVVSGKQSATELNNLGAFYYNEGRMQDAIEAFWHAMLMDPDNPLAFFNFGAVLEEFQQDEEAIEAYERAIQLSPDYANAHFNLALLYQKRKDPSKAFKHWQAYCMLDKVSPSALVAARQKSLAIAAIRAMSRLRLVA